MYIVSNFGRERTSGDTNDSTSDESGRAALPCATAAVQDKAEKLNSNHQINWRTGYVNCHNRHGRCRHARVTLLINCDEPRLGRDAFGITKSMKVVPTKSQVDGVSSGRRLLCPPADLSGHQAADRRTHRLRPPGPGPTTRPWRPTRPTSRDLASMNRPTSRDPPPRSDLDL